MSKERTFNLALVTKEKPVGFSRPPVSQQSVKHDGKPVQLKFD